MPLICSVTLTFQKEKTFVKKNSLLADFSYMSSLFHSVNKEVCYNPRKYPNGPPDLEDLEKQKVIVNG